jgi:uncharacterized SAM-binding protein YcdF (DUF218 family)
MAFFLSKVLWAFLSPGCLLALMLAGGLALEAASRAAWKKTGRILCVSATFCLAAIAILPVGDWALTPLENRFAFDPPDRVDGIVVLGGDEETEISEGRGQPVALDSMRRYVMLKDMERRYPDAKLVFSGGFAMRHPDGHIPPSDIADLIMTDIGVPTNRMIFEKNSRNTYENAVFSANLVHPNASQKWLLVTSAWHMPRAMGCFRQAGWNVFAAPTGYFTPGTYQLVPVRFEKQIRNLTLAAHEYVGLLSYWLMGRTSELWPG